MKVEIVERQPDPITLTYYQRMAHTTAQYPHENQKQAVNYCVCGIAGEVGELANKWKKELRGDHMYTVFDPTTVSQVTQSRLIDEAGDCLWYLAELATALGTTLNDIAKHNLAKLSARQSAGTIKGSGDSR